MVAESGKAVLGHGARLGDKYFCPSRVDALAVLDLPKVLQEPAVLRAGASAPSPHLFPPSDGEGTSEMTLNYGGDSNGGTTTIFTFLVWATASGCLLHGQWFTINWSTVHLLLGASSWRSNILENITWSSRLASCVFAFWLFICVALPVYFWLRLWCFVFVRLMIWITINYYLELLHGEVIHRKVLHGRRCWRRVILLLCVA